MNKQLIIQKLAFITEEMQQQTREWQSNGFNITNLEVDAFISNIKYLIEQAEFLNDLLLEAKEQSVVSNPQPAIEKEKIENKIDEAEAHVPEAAPGISEEEEEAFEPYIKGREVDNPELEVDSVKEDAGNKMDEVIGRVGEQPVNGPQSSVNSSANNQEPTTKSQQATTNEQYKSEQDSLLERLKKLYSEKSLGDQLKEKNTVKDFSFSLNERFFIINQVFNGESNTFEGMIASLKEFSSWPDAEKYLHTTFHHSHNWETKASDIEHFFEMIRERFNG